ncbi:hypothetical protein BGZ99_004914 [Dissophora globulifera]|uniref:Uncharacterized protein n=1 Tax=Dissophora globulifera TaxID=979702 RepID=A0A9P6RXK1_9FUNG|nr:hypothetical protein BGZ99_004914 [Dissophora globulifera]
MFLIINVAQLVNEFCVFFLITAAFDTISFHTALWLNVINNIAYFITKPTTMYLAYLRCSAVYPAFRKADWLHCFLIGFRAVELFAIVVVNIIQNQLCEGSVDKGTRCAGLAIAWTIRDAGAPIFRFYYIICEAIFYYMLFTTLKGISHGKNKELMQYRRLQTSLFTLDLILLVFMSIYRIIGIFNTHLPTYVYYELFSSTLTIFTLTEFGLNIRMLFNTATERRGQPNGLNERPRDPNGPPHRTVEIGIVSYRPPLLTNNSTSSLISDSGAGYGNRSEMDIAASDHPDDYIPYSKSATKVPPSDWRYPYVSNEIDLPFDNDDVLRYHPSVGNSGNNISGVNKHHHLTFDVKQTPVCRASASHSTSDRPPAVPERAQRSSARR